MSYVRLNPEDTGWQTVGTGCAYRRYGKMVTVEIAGVTNGGAGVVKYIGTLPTDCRPSKYLAQRMQPDGYMEINTDGTMNAKREGSGSAGSYCVITFPSQ